MLGDLLALLPLLILLTLVVVTIIGWWKVFKKAGYAGWKSLVPVYNLYLLTKISGRPGWWLLLVFVPIIGTAVQFLILWDLSKNFGKGNLYSVFFLIITPLLVIDLGWDTEVRYQPRPSSEVILPDYYTQRDA